MREAATILAALIGATVGSLGGVWLTGWQRRRDEERVRRRVLVQRHLWQLQDAAETLWHRLHNLKDEGGRYVMTDDYFAETTLYALGRVLAVERILGLEGVYPDVIELDPKLGEFLKANRVDAGLEGTNLYRYDRLALAEALIEPDGDHFRASTYVEFRRRYEDTGMRERTWLAPALQGIAQLDAATLGRLMTSLAAIAERLEAWTQLPSSIPEDSPKASGASETAPAARAR